MQVLGGTQHVESIRNLHQQNPQLDEVSRIQPKRMKFENVCFVQFLMYFYKIGSLEQLVMRANCPTKQTKLSHLIAMYGHTYLMAGLIEGLIKYEEIIGKKVYDFDKFLDRDLDSESDDIGSGGVQALY
jgi:hypothetical protein